MTEEDLVERCAIAAHNANAALRVALGEELHPWPRLSAEVQAGVRRGVRMLSSSDATPQELHASWVMNKLATGWVYGPVQDNEAKVHPCLVPFEELPEAQRAKDDLFRLVVRAVWNRYKGELS